MLTTVANWVENFVLWVTKFGPPETIFSFDFEVRALLAIVMVSLVSGAVGSLVVSSRMAFFSDAQAHGAFAGVALGVLIALILNIQDNDFRHWITLIMVIFGVVFGLLIAFVHEQSSLPNDTVIGVFFAGALGLGAIFSKAVRNKKLFDIESFIFGNPLQVESEELVWLFVLVILTGLFLVLWYNSLLFGSFNVSLARSRRVPARLAQYLFIVLLGIIVNVCQQTVGVLLITGLLIVPGATAANLGRNMRQVLWLSLAIAVFCGIVGLLLSWEINALFQKEIGIGGTVVVLSVVLFGLSMLRKR